MSADFALGVPYNIASYALLTMMIAQCVDMVPGEFIHTFGDVHLYRDHIATFRDIQAWREPGTLPTMTLSPDVKDIFGFCYDDFILTDYIPHEKLDYKISV